MKRREALQELAVITAGIDCTERYDDNGWWETTVGARFGAEILRQLEQLIKQLTED